MSTKELLKSKDSTFEEIGYTLLKREDMIDNLIDWISEATTSREAMKMDLEYLIRMDDEYIFSSHSTNEYIAISDNEDRFNELLDELKTTKEY